MSRVAKQASTKARGVRSDHGLGPTAPITDLLEFIEQRCGVPVAIFETLGGDTAGAYLPRDGDPVILLNGSDAPQRMRFTLAHELGHHVFHDDHREDTHAGLARPGHWIEVRANHFAAELLMPEEAMEVPDGPATLEDVRAVAARFGVSLLAACIRIGTCGGDTDEARRALDDSHELMYEESPFSDSLLAARRSLPRLPRSGSLLAAAASGEMATSLAAAKAGCAPDQVAGALAAAGLVPPA
jgi:Zn-dependent peptidase ImmA (M78 family)